MATIRRVLCSRGALPPSLARSSSTSAPAPPLELLHIIQQQIRSNGPIPLPRYMAYCLNHPTLGYYTRLRADAQQDTVLGKQGDFITSPEISSLFGELIAVWFVTQWQAQGSHDRIRIIELGPGRGTLMNDLVRTFTRMKSLTAKLASVHLVETSEYMRNQQRDLLDAKLRDLGAECRWHSKLDEVDQDDSIFTFLIAHEFFDALPIHLFERRTEGWREVMVDISRLSTGPPLRLAVSPGGTLPSEIYTKHPRIEALKTPGARVEISPESYGVAVQAGKVISGKAGGAALVVDYGDEKVFGSSFRAFKRHQLADPLAKPGQADLTANVDFTFLAEGLAQSAQPTRTLTQRDFLGAVGLNLRLERILRSAPEDQIEAIISSAERLVDPLTMGIQYRVMAAVPKSASPPLPFPAALST